MPYKKGQPSLMSTLANVPLSRGVARQQRFGEPYIRLSDFYELLSFLYEWGALIGRAKRDKLSTLEKMVLTPDRPWSIKFLQDQAKKRLEAYRNENREEPHSFIEFIEVKELADAIGLLALNAITHGDRKARKVLDKKIPLAEAALPIEEFGLEGIGFGSCFPTLTEIMYRTEYENITAQWSESRAGSWANPERHPEPSVEEREKDILRGLAAYALKYYPELLDPLDLRGHLDAP